MHDGCHAEKVGQEGKNRFDAPTGRSLQKRPRNDRADACVKEGVPERTRIGHKDADLFHQPRGKGTQRAREGATRTREISASRARAKSSRKRAEKGSLEPHVSVPLQGLLRGEPRKN